MLRSSHILVVVAAVLALDSSARAEQSGVGVSGVRPSDTIVPAPPTYKAGGVTVEEHLGSKLPLDTLFRTQDGTPTTLGNVIAVDTLPAILTFNYADCPQLCSLQLNGLTAAIPDVAAGADGMGLRLGVHYRVVTISLDPTASLEKLARMRTRYLDRLPADQREAAARGWTFLVPAIPGDDRPIHRVAEVVGFKYTYIDERAEWAHPAAYTFVSASGTITRYIYGFELERGAFRESIVKAGLSEASTALGYMHVCYYFDPDANNYSRGGVMAMRIGAAGFVVLLLAGFGLFVLLRRNTSSGSQSPGSSGEAT